MCCILYATEQTAIQTVVKAVSTRAKYTRLRKHTLATNTHTRTLSAITISLLLLMAYFAGLQISIDLQKHADTDRYLVRKGALYNRFSFANPNVALFFANTNVTVAKWGC